MTGRRTPAEFLARLEDEDKGWSGPLPRNIEEVERLASEPPTWANVQAIWTGCYVLLMGDDVTPYVDRRARDLMLWAYSALRALAPPSESKDTTRVRFAPHHRDAARLGLTLPPM